MTMSDAGLDVGIAGLADRRDAAVGDADVGLDDAPMVEDQRVGDHRVDGALALAPLALPHAVADHLAAAELDLLAIDRAVGLDLDHQVGVGEPHAVADGRAEHRGIGGPRDPLDHGSDLQRAGDDAAEAMHDAVAGEWHQPHRAGLPRLEAHGSAGGDVEPVAARQRAVEDQRRVGLEEMIVAADLDRPVAAVGDRQLERRSAGIELDVAGGGEQLSRDHGRTS
jgi:hypothetical protein